MPTKPMKTTVEVTAIDIPTMSDMPIGEYAEYVRSDLVHVDHHDILRSLPAGYPLATNKAQLRALISHLEELGNRMRDA